MINVLLSAPSDMPSLADYLMDSRGGGDQSCVIHDGASRRTRSAVWRPGDELITKAREELMDDSAGGSAHLYTTT